MCESDSAVCMTGTKLPLESYSIGRHRRIRSGLVLVSGSQGDSPEIPLAASTVATTRCRSNASLKDMVGSEGKSGSGEPLY